MIKSVPTLWKITISPHESRGAILNQSYGSLKRERDLFQWMENQITW